jgi:hypothetical protein
MSRPSRLFVLVAALPIAQVLSGCGGSTPTVNGPAVARAIAQSILTERHVYTTVSCPPDVPQEAGRTFTCTANLDVGTYPVPVTVVDGNGHVRWASQAPLVVLKIAGVERAIKRSIRSQRNLDATVQCPRQVLQRAGLVFKCTATVNGRSYPFTVTEVDGRGNVRFVGR